MLVAFGNFLVWWNLRLLQDTQDWETSKRQTHLGDTETMLPGQLLSVWDPSLWPFQDDHSCADECWARVGNRSSLPSVDTMWGIITTTLCWELSITVDWWSNIIDNFVQVHLLMYMLYLKSLIICIKKPSLRVGAEHLGLTLYIIVRGYIFDDSSAQPDLSKGAYSIIMHRHPL